jgi:hypothetical protein
MAAMMTPLSVSLLCAAPLSVCCCCCCFLFLFTCFVLGVLFVLLLLRRRYVYIKMNFHIPTVPTVTTPFPEYHGEGVFGTPSFPATDTAEMGGEYSGSEATLGSGGDGDRVEEAPSSPEL